MVRRQTLVPALAVIAGFALSACSDTVITQTGIKPGDALLSQSVNGAAGQRYVLIGAANALPGDLSARVAAAGGRLISSYSEIGVAIATGSDDFATAAASIAGVQSVVADIEFEQVQPRRVVELDDVGAAIAGNPNTNPFYSLQWAPGAIHAPAAWTAGYRGAGVRVAILDGGLFNAHPDLSANVDVSASRSFTVANCKAPPPAPVQPANCNDYNFDTGTFWHGTHVAGIVAASDNTAGVIGIAPDATLIGVKVLHNGSGAFSWIISGIMYAAKPRAEGGAGAHVINMSLGAFIDRGQPGLWDAGLRELIKAVDRATAYAWDRGVTVIAAAGNDATNLDDRAFINLPGQNNKVISVAATAPLGWAYGHTNFSRQASYTNGGKAGVDLAAPGGDGAWPTNENCTMSGLTRGCWVFDLYLSTSRAGYSWAAGTSMASPATAGVAALVIGKYAGMITPAGVKAKLQQGADDLGKPGNDDVYGAGFINALSSLNR
jgi:subtilisin family serine protease